MIHKKTHVEFNMAMISILKFKILQLIAIIRFKIYNLRIAIFLTWNKAFEAIAILNHQMKRNTMKSI
jgi:hypothetical protein